MLKKDRKLKLRGVNGWVVVKTIRPPHFTIVGYDGYFQQGHVKCLHADDAIAHFLAGEIKHDDLHLVDDPDEFTRLIDSEDSVEFIDDEYVCIDTDALIKEIPAAVFEDSYGDGKALAEGESFATYELLADAYNLNIYDFVR